jgi:lysyl-tRNA synthetase class 1
MIYMEEQKYEFWPDIIAKELVKKWRGKQVIVTGTSMSGEPHIGSANDVIRGHAIMLAVKKLKKPAELIWISDDMDPFRSVPIDLPKKLEDYLGIPVYDISDFWKCHKNFAKHFESRFLKQLESVNVKPKILLGIEMYRKGMYNKIIKLAIKKRKEIAEILNKFRITPLPEDWYPIDIICRKCGKITTTKILKYDKKSTKAEYFCDPEEILLHRKNPVQGCGHKEKISVLNGNAKLTWRVEWPARWVFLKTTCEPFGKEHAAAGGSWDTGKEIVRIFGWKPPYPVVYEHFLINGEKMSKSKGNVITVPDMLKYMTPEHLRYWMFQGKLTIAKDINLSKMIPHLFDEFDKAERIFFRKETTNDKRRDNNYKRAYELAVVKPKGRPVFNVPYNILVEILKIAPEKNKTDFIIEKLKEYKHLEKVSVIEKKYLESRLNLIGNWMKDFLKIKEEKAVVGEMEKVLIKNLIKIIEMESNPEKMQNHIFELIKNSGVGVGEGFKVIYKILLKSDRGPKLGPYIIEVGKKEIIKKLQSAL